MPPTRLVLTIALATALALPASAGAVVRKVSFTGTVSPNDYASLTVRVSPRSRCTITVVYDTVVSSARGLNAKTGTKLTWRWKVGSATHPGRWPVKVNCGKAGALNLRLHVRR